MPDHELSPTLMEEVDISLIAIPPNWRAIDEVVMPALMDSISAIGLLHPITVTGTITGKYELAGGRHRLEAHIRLKRKTILVRVLGREQAGMARPSENYHRAAYSELESSEDMIAYRDQRLLCNGGSEQARPKGGVQPNDRGNSRTARLFGTSPKRVRNAEAHVSICDEAKAILRSNAKAQTVVGLNRIAGLRADDDQIEAAMLLVNGTKKPSRLAKKQPRPAKKPSPAATFPFLWAMWTKTQLSHRFNSAGEDVQNQFLAKLKPDAGQEDWA